MHKMFCSNETELNLLKKSRFFLFISLFIFAVLRAGTGSDKLSAEIMTTVQGDDVI